MSSLRISLKISILRVRMVTFGLGLSFCKKVMKSFGGSIACSSEFGEWTEFELKFPDCNSTEVIAIKQELMKAKTVLFIGEQLGMLGRQIKNVAFQSDLNLTIKSLAQASELEEHQYEYSLIIIDGDLDANGWSLMSRLESKLGFTEGRIAFVHDEDSTRNLYFQRYVDIELYGMQKFVDDPANAIDYLLFEEFDVEQPAQPYNEISIKRTVMIVDDNHSLRSITSIMLEKQGLHVIQAENGQLALQTLEKEDVDLILMDIEMPIMDGLTATRHIRQSDASYASVPIVGYTGDKSEETVVKINEYGMNDYLVKPTPKDELIDKVATWIY
ncbi:sensor histidine kinase CqsS [Vibrio variabilis]|uniref:Sensor histidine kinase CqsS n=1 Tax=Vibrio variabilis TaxID=990271 RepID=A0ABQ0JID3_9VIBR|nr:sensor histidine kinase CqsS [Vibrio variabilis]